jgi:hypothetical protein
MCGVCARRWRRLNLSERSIELSATDDFPITPERGAASPPGLARSAWAASKEMNTMRDRGCIRQLFQPPVVWTLVGCHTLSRVAASSLNKIVRCVPDGFGCDTQLRLGQEEGKTIRRWCRRYLRIGRCDERYSHSSRDRYQSTIDALPRVAHPRVVECRQKGPERRLYQPLTDSSR